ncbi:hypothetical protein KQX54_006243 [Cotesia glomerata]|uniref:Uncharacterized protein n=1 Tax=Cotesia glomerata TaxID=32391 RepID=A0AAV7I7P6_COTGL|nr:hypothetical protein KQX54_006243 [Cotesia glomerata]
MLKGKIKQIVFDPRGFPRSTGLIFNPGEGRESIGTFSATLTGNCQRWQLVDWSRVQRTGNRPPYPVHCIVVRVSIFHLSRHSIMRKLISRVEPQAKNKKTIKVYDIWRMQSQSLGFYVRAEPHSRCVFSGRRCQRNAVIKRPN